MAMESAKDFVEKFFNDDEFIKEFYKKGGLVSGKDVSEEEQQAKTAEIAKEMGYDFTPEEYQAANKEYIESIGAWKAIKKLFHFAKIAKAADKEAKKEAKKKK